MVSEEIVLYAVGDIAPDREDPASILQHVASILNTGDAVFGQLEAVLSERGTPLPQARLPCRGHPSIAGGLKDAGFDVVSFASNHCMDWGREAFLDTIDALESAGLSVVGAGRDIEEARKPAIVDCTGTRVAFLAYNSILPAGYWADAGRPGCAPMRALTLYEQIELDQPGTPCRVHTYAHRDDLRAMEADIVDAKARADLVVVSMHWGIHFVPAVLAEYQREIALAAIDAGADLIVGTHAHILKGIEVYAGKVIFYSLCNFALDLRAPQELIESPQHREIEVLNPDWKPDPEYPTYFMPPDSRKTIVAKCSIADRHIRRVSFLPVYINRQSQPEVLVSSDPRFDEVVGYLDEITTDQGLGTMYTVEGDEVVIHEGCA